MVILRAIFVAWGLFLCLSGGSLLMIDKMVLTFKEDTTDKNQDDEEFRGLFMEEPDANDQKVFNPPDWLAFSLMSVGSVTTLYAIALPRRRD